jgi:hypothetical protein
MNELTGLAIQQRPNNAEALAQSILTQLSRDSHEPRSISTSFPKIDKLGLPVTITKRTYLPSRAVSMARRDCKSTERSRCAAGNFLAECIF